MLIELLNSHFAKPVLSAGVLRVLVYCLKVADTLNGIYSTM